MVILGRFTRNKFFSHDQQESKGGVNSLLGALFGLWGFLLAFTFSNSATRYENVRVIGVDESNIIKNTILRSRVFPDSIKNIFQKDLISYVDAQIAYYQNIRDYDKFMQSIDDGSAAGERLWATNVGASRQPNMGPPSTGMFASLTTMFDTASRRDALLRAGVPEMITYMLFFLALTISFIGGFTTPGIKAKEWIVVIGFLLLACTIIFITLDLGRPLRSFIKPPTGVDRLIEVRKMLE